MGGVNHDHLKPLVSRVLRNPVRIEHAKSSAAATHAGLSQILQVTLRLLLVDTCVLRLAVVDTLGHQLFAVASLNLHTVHNVTLLGLVAETVGLVGAGGLSSAVDGGQLTELPCAQTQQEAHHIRLLLVPQLLQILVGSH